MYDLRIIDEPLAYGADVHAVCFRSTALQLASNRGSHIIFEFDLQVEGSINVQDPGGDTPATMALSA